MMTQQTSVQREECFDIKNKACTALRGKESAAKYYVSNTFTKTNICYCIVRNKTKKARESRGV